MKIRQVVLPLIAAGIGAAVLAVAQRVRRTPVQRIGMVIGIRPDRTAAYEALHAASNPGVRDLLRKYHMHNFSIFLEEFSDGNYYLFGYYEYTGANYQLDMEKLAAEPRNRRWLDSTDPMQVPLSGKHSWSIMREVYYNQ